MIVLELALVGLLVVTAILIALVRDPIGAIAVFAVFSLGLSIVWVWLAAPDVGLTEAAVGAGVMVVILLIAAVRTTHGDILLGSLGRRTVNLPALALAVLVSLLLAASVATFPEIGDPEAPAVQPQDPAGTLTPYAAYIGESTAEREVPNAVAAVLTIFRSLDTLGEVVVAFAAVVGVLIVLGRPDLSAVSLQSPQEGQPDPYVMSPIGMTAVRLVVPLVFIFGVYLTVQGAVQPGGGFQGGIVMGAAFVLMTLIFGHVPTANWVDHRVLVWILVLGIGLIFLLVGGRAIVGAVSTQSIYNLAPVYIVDAIEIGIGMSIGAVVIALVFAMALRREGVENPEGDRR